MYFLVLESYQLNAVIWLNDSDVMSIAREVFAPRASIEGTGNVFNLVIRNITTWDEGPYNCQVPGVMTQTNQLTVNGL